MSHNVFALRIDEDIEIRLNEERYAQKLFDLTDKNRQYLREWLPWVDGTVSVEDTRAFMKSTLHSFADFKSIGTTIWYKDQLVGSLGCSIDKEDRKVEIGYWLDASSQDKGIMTRACRGLINYVFDELEMNKVEIHVAPENRRSRAIPERLGFTQEGIDRQAGWLYDHYIDLVLYGMLASEWKR